MHLPFLTPEDPRPEGQAENAAEAQPNPHDPAVHAHAPSYGSFGHLEDAANAAAAGETTRGQNDGSNDNPDEFSEFRTAAQPGTQGYKSQTTTATSAGAASYNGGRDASNAHPEAFEKAEDVARAAFAEDDPRYGSGTESSWASNEPAQENTDMKGGFDPAPKV
ncbi:hypothetical protein [uncultured Hymenobacter sp.]|uniref:hypothetical protein n=1 Tax=uncultured Hymenobacter sp. TaxID=170016 RepID=UPI0035CAEFE8